VTRRSRRYGAYETPLPEITLRCRSGRSITGGYKRPQAGCSGSGLWAAPVGGISHNEIEDAKPEDLTAGCAVRLNAVLDSADAGGARQG
jgi:hypothetical protein